MDLVWSNHNAVQSFMETLHIFPNLTILGVPELLSALAAGWMSKLIVEPWTSGDCVEASVGLTVAALLSGGRHVFIVPTESFREDYLRLLQQLRIILIPEIVVAEEAETVMPQFENVDFLIVDCNNHNFDRVLRAAKLRPQGAVIVRKNVNAQGITSTQFEWRVRQEAGVIVERSVPTTFFDILYTRSMAPPPQPPLQPQPQPQQQPEPLPQQQPEPQPQQQPQPEPQQEPQPPPHSPRHRPMLWFRIIDPRNSTEIDFHI